MSKVRVSFVIDTASLGLGADVKQGIVAGLLQAANTHHAQAQSATRADRSMPDQSKGEAIAVAVRGMMLSRMAEANLTIDPMPGDTPVVIEMAFGGSD